MGFFRRGASTPELRPDLPTEAVLANYVNFTGGSGTPMSAFGRAAQRTFGDTASMPTWLLLLDLGIAEWAGDVRSDWVDEMISTIEATGPLRCANVAVNLMNVIVTEREGEASPAHLRGAHAEFSHGADQVDPSVVDDQWDLGYFYITRLDEALRRGKADGGWDPIPFIGQFKASWADGNGYIRAINKTLQFTIRPLGRAINDGQIPVDHVSRWIQDRIVLADVGTFEATPPTPPPTGPPAVPCADADQRLVDLGFSSTEISTLRQLDLRRHVTDTVTRLHPTGSLGSEPHHWTRLRAAAALLAPTSPSALESFRSELYDLTQGIADFEPTPSEVEPLLRAAHSVLVPLVAAAEEGRPKLRQQAAMILAVLDDSNQPADPATVDRVLALFGDRNLRGVSGHASRFLEERLPAQEA